MAYKSQWGPGRRGSMYDDGMQEQRDKMADLLEATRKGKIDRADKIEKERKREEAKAAWNIGDSAAMGAMLGAPFSPAGMGIGAAIGGGLGLLRGITSGTTPTAGDFFGGLIPSPMMAAQAGSSIGGMYAGDRARGAWPSAKARSDQMNAMKETVTSKGSGGITTAPNYKMPQGRMNPLPSESSVMPTEAEMFMMQPEAESIQPQQKSSLSPPPSQQAPQRRKGSVSEMADAYPDWALEPPDVGPPTREQWLHSEYTGYPEDPIGSEALEELLQYYKSLGMQ